MPHSDFRKKTEEEMKVAITGGTGFVGRHLAQRLLSLGHQPILLVRGRDRRNVPVAPVIHTDLSDPRQLAEAIQGCDAIAHCAGINRQIGVQTYGRVHIEGTRNVIEAAKRSGVSRVLMLSFLRARPNCGSPYHESKFQAEELLRQSALNYTILKAGMIYSHYCGRAFGRASLTPNRVRTWPRNPASQRSCAPRRRHSKPSRLDSAGAGYIPSRPRSHL
jgi:nucleoside-diphosphate-sugar epimerase